MQVKFTAEYEHRVIAEGKDVASQIFVYPLDYQGEVEDAIANAAIAAGAAVDMAKKQKAAPVVE